MVRKRLEFFNNSSAIGTKSALLRSTKTPEQKTRIIAELTERNRLLEQKIDALIKILYGVKSEKIDPAQLQLLLDGLEQKKPQAPSGNETEEPEGADEVKSANKKTKSKNHSRLKGWEQLEVIEQTIFPDGYEEHKDQLELIGQEVTELLDYIPARLIK
ncbi:hypothetical protein OAL23_01195 [bacterium]|nr:hypothetical protein [bacterium]